MAVSAPESGVSHLVHTLTLVRHASTAWSKSGQHTGRTDIPLDDDGRLTAAALAPVVASLEIDQVYSSPLQRARETCALAGLGDRCTLDDDLLEWDYGAYEGRTTAEIHRERPGWDLFRDGCPGGEDADAVGGRVDAFLERIACAGGGSVVAFAHGHVLRVLAARWLGLAPAQGALFTLGAPSISTLGWEHENPAVIEWNR